MPLAKVKYFVCATLYCVTFIDNASAESCRNFLAETRAAIGKHVATLQRFEHEASDRLKGLDSRPFDFLLGEARKTAAIISDPAALKREEDLRCSNPTRPARKICAAAAQALMEVLEKHVASPKPDYDKPRFADTMAECEKLMDLKPLKSAIRGTD